MPNKSIILGTAGPAYLRDEVLDVGALLQQSLGQILLLARVILGKRLLGYVLHAAGGVNPSHPTERRLIMPFRSSSFSLEEGADHRKLVTHR